MERTLQNGSNSKNKLKKMQFGDLTEVQEIEHEDTDLTHHEENSTEINAKDKITLLKEELEDLKTQVKIMQDELSYQKKEELNQHKQIVDLRNDINTVKTYARKLKLKNKREKEKERESTLYREASRNSRLSSAKLKRKAGGIEKIPDLILQEDVDMLESEV
jgi:hypothetical protein